MGKDKKLDNNEKEVNLVEKCWNENVKENIEDIDIICYNADQLIQRDFCIHFRDSKTGVSQYHALAGWFYAVYEAIKFVMNTKARKKSSMSSVLVIRVDICGRFIMGFSDHVDNSDIDDMDEKEGNYVLSMMRSDKSSRKLQFSDEENLMERLATWERENITNNNEFIEKVKIQAAKNIKNLLGFTVASNSCIMPVFMYVYDCFIDYYEKKLNDSDENSDFAIDPRFNFCSCFIADANYDEENNKWIIGFTTSIPGKSDSKDDLTATSKYE